MKTSMSQSSKHCDTKGNTVADADGYTAEAWLEEFITKAVGLIPPARMAAILATRVREAEQRGYAQGVSDQIAAETPTNRAIARAEQRGAEKAWDEGKAAGLCEGKVVSPFHDRFRSVNPYRADATRSQT